MSEIKSARLDKWLWAARFYKTRTLAAEAILGGKVHLNGQRTKPGKEIGPGARLQISKDAYQWDIRVTGITLQRRPAKEAILLYEETAESQAQRQAEISRQSEERALLSRASDRRPNKKERRQIHHFKRN